VAYQPKALAIPKTAMSAAALITRMKILFICLSFQGLMLNTGEDIPPPLRKTFTNFFTNFCPPRSQSETQGII
jgi:hypothetical protein